ncbi:hypothetical protein [Streptomyces capparidis]
MRIPTLVGAVGAAALLSLGMAGTAMADTDDLIKIRLQDLDREDQYVNAPKGGKSSGPVAVKEDGGALLALDLQSQEDEKTVVNAHKIASQWLGNQKYE